MITSKVFPSNYGTRRVKKIEKIDSPDPIQAIKFRMEQKGLTQSDLAEAMGGKNRASEVLNGKRILTLKMARELHKRFNITAESLLY